MSDFEPNADGATAVADAPPEPSPDPTAPPEASVDAVPDDPQQAPLDPQDPAQTHDDAKVRRAMALLTQTRANAGKGPPPPNAPDGSPDRVQAALDLIHRTKAEKSAKKASGNPAQRLSELTASAQARGAEGAAATKAGQDVAFYSHDPADIAKRILQLHTQFGGDPEKTSNALRKEGWDGSLITPKLIADTKGQIQQITQQMQQMVQRAQEAQQMAENPPEQPEGQDGSAGQQPPPMPPDPQQMAAVLSVGQSKVQALQALQAQLEKEWGGDNLKFSQGPAPISTEPTKGPGLLDQLGSFLNSAASSYERIGGQGTGAGAPQKPSAPDYPKDMGGLQPTPDPGMLANLGRGLAHGAVKEGPSAITGGPEAARRMPEGQGVAGFVGETAGGLAGGLFNPKNLAANILGYFTGLKAVEAAAPVLGKVATMAGPRVAGVLEHMIGGVGGTAPLSMIEKAQSIDPERWLSDPLGVLKEIGQAGATGGALGAGIGAVSGTVTRAVHDPSPAARMAGAVIGSDKPASEIVKATEDHLIENGGLPAESRAGGAQVGAIYEAATQAMDRPVSVAEIDSEIAPHVRELIGHSSDHQQARTALAAIAEAEVAKAPATPETPAPDAARPVDQSVPVESPAPVEASPESGSPVPGTSPLPESVPQAIPDRIAASFLDWVKQHDPESLTRMEAVKNAQTSNQIGPEGTTRKVQIQPGGNVSQIDLPTTLYHGTTAEINGSLKAGADGLVWMGTTADNAAVRGHASLGGVAGSVIPVDVPIKKVFVTGLTGEFNAESAKALRAQGYDALYDPEKGHVAYIGDVGGVKKPVAKMTAAELRSELEAGPNEIVNLNSAPRASLMKAVKYLRDEAAASDRPLQAMGAASRFDPEIVAAATDRARTLAVHGSESTQPPGKFAESLRQLWSGAKEQAAYFLHQTGAPFLRTIAPDSADALVKVGAARERVQAHSAELTGKVLDGAKPDDPNVKLAGIVLDEDNARGTVDAYIQQAAELDRAASKASMAGNAEEANHLGTESQKILAKAQEVKSHVGEGGTFPTEEEYQAAAAKPEVQAIIDRYRDNVNPYTEELYKTAKRLDPATELPSRGRQFGVRINRLAMNLGDESSGTTVGVGGVPSGLARGRLRGAKFDVRATGTGEAYNTSIPDMIGASVGGNMERAALHQTYDQLVKDGVAEYSDSPKSILIDGIPTRAEEIRTDPRKEPAKWIQIREDAWRDVNRVLARGEPTNIPGFTAASKTTTGSAIVGVAEPVAHIFNLLGAAALRPYRSAGGLGMIAEGLSRSPIPGGKFVANISALIPKLIDVIHNDPVAAEGWSQLADVGTARAESANSGLVGTALAKFDKAVRLVLNDTFDHLVERGEAVDSPGNRAEFTSLPGNYSRRLSGDIVRVLKDTGVNPFATQKKAAIVQAKDALTLNPGYEATTTAKAVQSRLEQALPTILAPIVGTVIANYAINGAPWGRPGTTFGAIDTGKDDENGKIIQSDLLWKASGLRRVAGVTGATDFAAKIRAGEGAGDATNAAMRQAGNNLLGFLAGPAANFASETVAGQRIGFGLPRTSPVVPEGPGLKQGLVNAGYAAAQLNKTATKIASSGVRMASPDAADAMVRATGDQDGSVLGDLSKIALPSGRDSSRANDQAQIDHAVKINNYVEDLSSLARRQPIDKRADFINAEIAGQSEADQAVIWSKLKRSGVLSHP